MADKDTPDRVTISLPEDAPIDTDTIDELVSQSECQNRSEYIRQVLADESDPDSS